MNYTSFDKRLASELRYKNYPPEEVAEIVAEARAHVAASNQDPTEEFGNAEEYRKRTGRTLFMVSQTWRTRRCS